MDESGCNLEDECQCEIFGRNIVIVRVLWDNELQNKCSLCACLVHSAKDGPTSKAIFFFSTEVLLVSPGATVVQFGSFSKLGSWNFILDELTR